MNADGTLYGVIAEFPDAPSLLQAARSARAAGYVGIDAYSPMAVEGLSEAVGFKKDRLARFALLGGIAAGVGTFVLQWYSISSAYPLNIGARTPSWPGLVPATFEMTILGAVLAIFFGMLFSSGLPKLNHPIFEVPEFALASRDRFFLCIRALDSQFNAQDVRRFLETLHPLKVTELAN